MASLIRRVGSWLQVRYNEIMHPLLKTLTSFRLVLAVLVLSGSRPAAADTQILKGLGRSFVVSVESLDQEGRKAGLSESGLSKVIASRLVKRGFKTTTAGPELYTRIVVLTSHDTKGEVLGYGAHVELSCREKALLKRDRTTEFTAPIWFKGKGVT